SPPPAGAAAAAVGASAAPPAAGAAVGAAAGVLPPQAASRPAVIAISKKKLARLFIEFVLLKHKARNLSGRALSIVIVYDPEQMGASQACSADTGRTLTRAKLITRVRIEEP